MSLFYCFSPHSVCCLDLNTSAMVSTHWLPLGKLKVGSWSSLSLTSCSESSSFTITTFPPSCEFAVIPNVPVSFNHFASLDEVTNVVTLRLHCVTTYHLPSLLVTTRTLLDPHPRYIDAPFRCLPTSHISYASLQLTRTYLRFPRDLPGIPHRLTQDMRHLRPF